MRVEATRFVAEATGGSQSADFVTIGAWDNFAEDTVTSFQITTETAKEMFGVDLKPGRSRIYSVPKWKPVKGSTR